MCVLGTGRSPLECLDLEQRSCLEGYVGVVGDVRQRLGKRIAGRYRRLGVGTWFSGWREIARLVFLESGIVVVVIL